MMVVLSPITLWQRISNTTIPLPIPTVGNSTIGWTNSTLPSRTFTKVIELKPGDVEGYFSRAKAYGMTKVNMTMLLKTLTTIIETKTR